MAAKKINLKGTPNVEYNLDEMQNTGSRTDSTRALVVQIWEWCPDLPKSNERSRPNPPEESLVIGQMWLSKRISLEEATAKNFGVVDGN